MELTKVLISNYLPYAKGTIISRAIPDIDGLKPSHRKILYTMYKMGLLNGDKTKSSNIVGQTMRLHPHGDQAIYDTLVRMSIGNEALNVPYIESKGNFGKCYSKELSYAAARYTEAKLAQICNEIFDNIDDDAVDFVNNFDDTTTEPSLLPVKFPTVLVNTASGIAVGTSSDIPSFNLKNVCDATIGMIKKEIDNAYKLMEVIGTPEFSTGGFVHANQASLESLGKSGEGSFVVSGHAKLGKDRIEIDEIPYKTTSEAIITAIEEYAKSGELREVADVRDDTSLAGFKIVVELKKNANAGDVANKILALTPFRTSMTFHTRVIINGECKEIGVYKLLKEWINFRMNCIKRIYKFKHSKSSKQEHLLASWELISLNIKDVAKIVSERNEEEAKKELMKYYKLDDTQAEYIMDMKIRMFTHEKLIKRLEELTKVRTDLAEFDGIVKDDEKKKEIIISDLERIRDKYGKDRKTKQADIIKKERIKIEAAPIDSSQVLIVLTENGYIKKLNTVKSMAEYTVDSGDKEVKRISMKNSEHLLVFTRDGEIHKLLADNIDASRGSLKDELYKMLKLKNRDEIIFVDGCGDYSKYINILYANGKGKRVFYRKAGGNRTKYTNAYETVYKGEYWLVTDKFFMVTQGRKACYCDISLMNLFGDTRSTFKVCRMNGEEILGVQPIENVPNIDSIDINKYKKQYPISIGKDVLWVKTSKK